MKQKTSVILVILLSLFLFCGCKHLVSQRSVQFTFVEKVQHSYEGYYKASEKQCLGLVFEFYRHYVKHTKASSVKELDEFNHVLRQMKKRLNRAKKNLEITAFFSPSN